MTESLLLAGGRVVTPDAVLDDGAVLVAGGAIAAVLDDGVPRGAAGWDSAGGTVGADLDAAMSSARRIDLAGGYLLPGLIDLHVHGAATASFDDGAEAIGTAVAAHRRHGTTGTLVSLITAAPDDMVTAIRGAVAAAGNDPRILGIHLEGPFLAENRRGAHDPAKMLAPDAAVLQRFLDAGDGLIRMVTLAPELPGGLDLVRLLVDADVHAAVGHSDAGYDDAVAAFQQGADIVTHAFNGMRPLHHRDPGIIAAGMDAGAALEAINDGVHLHDATVRLLHAVAPGRLALVTDAMAAACAADGHYVLGSLDVDVVDGVARLATDGGEPGSIAGSTLTMDVAVRRAVLDVGMDVVDAVNAASLVPARLLGVADRAGAILTGRPADLVITDQRFGVRAVLAGGAWADERRP